VGTGLFDQIGGYSARSWTALFYLGFFGTVLGFFWYYSGIKRIGPMKASVFINLVPVSAIFLAYFILGERLTPAMFGGGLLVITGVYLTNSSAWMGRKPETAKLGKQVKAS
jgi:drug/metabolite transporter (DMT)-like permease